jgi:inorganic pyrophosphatase
MSFKNVKAGINPPDDFNSIIEIPANAKPIKYEVNKEYDALLVDRFLSTAMSYPSNYGYIPQTLSEDGDPLDVFVIAPHAVAVGSVIRSRPVGCKINNYLDTHSCFSWTLRQKPCKPKCHLTWTVVS